MEQLKRKALSVLSLAFVAALAAGAVSANVTAQADTNWEQFAITATSVRLDDTTREGIDSGLRFKVDSPVDASANEETVAYTMLTFTSSVEGGLKNYSANVPAGVWRKDGSGWNTVLMDIPVSDYVTEITAKAFITVDGQTYETEAVTSSIAKTASHLLAGGATNEELKTYVAGAVQEITMDATAVIETVGATKQLAATTNPAGYGVVWTSSNTDVAEVDANGLVTAKGLGKATITAAMSGVTANCEVSVGDQWVRNNNVSAYGATISGKQQVVLQRSVPSNGEWWQESMPGIDAGYVAFNGSYGVGDFVAFDFTGNNMPIITLAAKQVEKDWRNVDISNAFAVKDATDGGFVVMNGRTGVPGEGDYHTDAHNKRIAAFGPYKFQNLDDIQSGQQASGSTASNVGVGFAELVGSTDKFRVIVGLESFTTSEAKIGVVVLNLTKGTQPEFNTITLNLSSTGLSETFEGSIMLHGRLGMETTIDKLYPVYQNTSKDAVRDLLAAQLPEWAQDAGITAYGATVNADQSVVLKNGSGVWWPDESGSLDLGYVAFNGNYGVGDFVVVDFTGNNMPYITLAAKNITNDYRNVVRTDGPTWSAADKADTGFVIANGYFGGSGESDYHNSNFNKRMNVFGPYKQQTFEGSSDDQQWASTGLNQGIGRIELIGSTDQFRLIVGIESFTTTEVQIGIVVVNLTQKTVPVYNTVTLNLSGYGLTSTFEGSIIVHGRRGMETKLDKVYSIYENTDKGTVKWSIPGSDF